MTKKFTKQAATLERTLTTINRTLGKGTILRLGDTSPLTVTTFSSGSFELDQALGGGYPRGRIILIGIRGFR